MRVSVPLLGPLFGIVVALASPSPAATWRDPSPHTVRFMTVENEVRLEVLDWGGSGRPLLLLAGGGNTAHVFDELAPKLAAIGHVYAITRRGFGASGFSPSENAIDRLRDDVLAIIDALHLDGPVLAGHSIAGAELSAVAVARPRRIAGLIYLEAAYPYAFQKGGGPTMKHFLENNGPQAPTPTEPDRASFDALQMWDASTYGFRMPESEFRQTWETAADGRPRNAREAPGMKTVMAALMDARAYASIPAPVLAVFASPHIPEPWVGKSPDSAARRAATAYLGALNELTEAQAKDLATGVPGARVVRLRGTHYIFLSNEEDVLREMRAFVGTLK